MTFNKHVILIYGVPCAGKYTVAKTFAERHGLYLVDNHFFNNLIFPFVDLNFNNKQNNDDLFDGILQIKKIWFDNVAKHGKLDKGFIFTNALDNSPEDRKCLQQFIDFAKKINYRFVPIKLVVDEEHIRKNIANQDRKDRCKLADFNAYQKFIRAHEMIDIPNSIVVKNEDVDETIRKIEKEVLDLV